MTYYKGILYTYYTYYKGIVLYTVDGQDRQQAIGLGQETSQVGNRVDGTEEHLYIDRNLETILPSQGVMEEGSLNSLG